MWPRRCVSPSKPGSEGVKPVPRSSRPRRFSKSTFPGALTNRKATYPTAANSPGPAMRRPRPRHPALPAQSGHWQCPVRVTSGHPRCREAANPSYFGGSASRRQPAWVGWGQVSSLNRAPSRSWSVVSYAIVSLRKRLPRAFATSSLKPLKVLRAIPENGQRQRRDIVEPQYA